MTLEAFLLFLAGAVLESGLLWSQAQRGGFSRLAAGLRGAGRVRWLALFGGLAAGWAALVLAARLLGWSSVVVSLSDDWVQAIFVGLGLFLLAAGVLGDALLPRINERSLLTAQVLVLLLSLSQLPPRLWFSRAWPAAVPLLFSLGLLFSRRAPSAAVRAAAYLGYLLSLLYLTYQTADMGLFSAAQISGMQGFAFGSLFIFLGLHCLFALRFAMLVSSLLLPRNRPAIGRIMPRLFSEKQASARRFGIFSAAAAGLFWLNAQFNLISSEMLVGLLVLLSAQVDNAE